VKLKVLLLIAARLENESGVFTNMQAVYRTSHIWARVYTDPKQMQAMKSPQTGR